MMIGRWGLEGSLMSKLQKLHHNTGGVTMRAIRKRRDSQCTEINHLASSVVFSPP